MKRLIDSEYEYNEKGMEIYKKFKNLIAPEFLKEVKKGVEPKELIIILNEVINKSFTDSIKYLNYYFNNKGYDIDKLEIKHNETNETKYAEFIGYDNKGHRFWKYEENYTPTAPFGLKATGTELEWYLLTSNEDKDWIDGTKE